MAEMVRGRAVDRGVVGGSSQDSTGALMAHDVDTGTKSAVRYISFGPMPAGVDESMYDQDLKSVLDRLVRHVGLLLEVPSCSVGLLDPATMEVVTLSSLHNGAEV